MSVGASPVQNPTGTSGGTASMTIAVTAPGAGNVMLQLIAGATTNGTNTPTLTNTSGWTKVSGPNTTTNCEIWAGDVAAGAGTSLVSTAGVAHSYRGSACEWAGITLAGATGLHLTNTATTNPVTASITPTPGANCVLIAVCAGSTGAGSAPTNGFTALATANSLQQYSYLVVTSASGSYSTGWTYSLSNTCSACIAVFYAPSAGGRIFLLSGLDGLSCAGPKQFNPSLG